MIKRASALKSERAGRTDLAGAAPVLRAYSRSIPKAIVIGASTGGPEALTTLLQSLQPCTIPVPIFIVLHMPADFSTMVAAYLERVSGRQTSTATHGFAPLPGHIYIAPAGRHLRLHGRASRAIMHLDDGDSENYCKPAVDVLFRSAAASFGSSLLAIVLTGTGQDGLDGSRAVVEAGGNVIVQDQATSAAWGMPGAVAENGFASAILSIDVMGLKVASLFRGPVTERAG
ncbi:CheB methylesterase domain-containing protein [Roseiarcaceae bacterium H3SJ34-1]|uniref:CheB methylesterase domain-containing protein n=1 Tax=Terripilifer ovatus TaxID=3032367 RepID=UPI003AB933D2|nr:CheB methylesterase domain-containing protein [Roseiarcaceae bacterium H3SJ34-1]